MKDNKVNYKELPPMAYRARVRMARDLRLRLLLGGAYLALIFAIPFVNTFFSPWAMSKGPMGLPWTWVYTGVFTFGLAVLVTALQVFLARRRKGETHD